MKTTTRTCVLCGSSAKVTDWEPVAACLAVEGCQCGGFLVWTPLWDDHLTMLSEMQRNDVVARVQEIQAGGRAVWLTTSDGRIDGELMVTTDRPRLIITSTASGSAPQPPRPP